MPVPGQPRSGLPGQPGLRPSLQAVETRATTASCAGGASRRGSTIAAPLLFPDLPSAGRSAGRPVGRSVTLLARVAVALRGAGLLGRNLVEKRAHRVRTEDSGLLSVGEQVGAGVQGAAGRVERVPGPAAVAAGLLLDAPPALIECLAGEADDGDGPLPSR